MRESSRRFVAILFIVILPLLLGLVAFVNGSVWRAFDFQTNIREAQLVRSDLLRAQLDEETSLRGFTSTRRTIFVRPYNEAAISFIENVARLSSAIQRVDSGQYHLQTYVGKLAAEHQQWVDTVAEPLLHHPTGSDALSLQLEGKRSIDDFRQTDRLLRDALELEATNGEKRLKQVLSFLFAFVVVSLATIGLTIAFYGRQHDVLHGSLEAETEERQRIEEALHKQRELVTSMQEVFLQKILPAVPRLRLDAVYLPSSVDALIGGDWYDVLKLQDGRMLFSLGDVMGHGVDASVMMALVRQMIISAALQNKDPAAILQTANVELMRQRHVMATAVCGYIDPVTLEIVYATAGHPPPILADIIRGAEFLPHAGIPLGIEEELASKTFTVRAEGGSTLVLYTDGLVEVSRDILAGERDLLEAARISCGVNNPAHVIRDLIFQECSPRDDVALLTIAFDAVPGEG